jgi:acyl-CoA thioester hydrolase
MAMLKSIPTISQIDELPVLMRKVIPPEWKDINGHLNIAYYMHLFNDSFIPMLRTWGLEVESGWPQRWGVFDLEHHVWYLREVHVGDEVTLHCRLIARNAKRFHATLFLVNRTRGELSSALEFISTGADLECRTTAALPPQVTQPFDAMLEAHDKLSWICPTSGSRSP